MVRAPTVTNRAGTRVPYTTVFRSVVGAVPQVRNGAPRESPHLVRKKSARTRRPPGLAGTPGPLRALLIGGPAPHVCLRCHPTPSHQASRSTPRGSPPVADRKSVV